MPSAGAIDERERDTRQRLEQLNATVAALRDPRSYPGAVARVTALETHMAWVFLTETRAYKLKKPIRMELFDHRTMRQRQRACEIELRLNRRLGPDVYLSVVPVVAYGEELYVDAVEPGGTVVDWLVEMRRLPRERMLHVCIEQATVREDDVERLLDVLVPFYAAADPGGMGGAAYRAHLADNLESKRRSLQQPHYGLDRAAVQRLVDAQQRWLDAHQTLLHQRASRVVDAHGDLRPEHICLEEPKPVVIDCLEFHRLLRLLDPVSELSFLALECDRLGAEWIGTRLRSGYAQRTGDRPPPSLVGFYESLHAVVRAAVAIWHLDDGDHADFERWRARARWYLERAEQHL